MGWARSLLLLPCCTWPWLLGAASCHRAFSPETRCRTVYRCTIHATTSFPSTPALFKVKILTHHAGSLRVQHTDSLRVGMDTGSYLGPPHCTLSVTALWFRFSNGMNCIATVNSARGSSNDTGPRDKGKHLC